MSPTLILTNFCVLDKDSHKAKFSFKLDKYSEVLSHRITKPFHFAGHYWKLQITKKDGYFGMFLRWYGTDRTVDHTEIKFSCTASMVFSIINKLLLEDSVSEGKHKEKDTFERLRGGIGYSKIIKLEELEKSSGYIINDVLYLQLLLKTTATTYYDKLSCNRELGCDYVKGSHFQFYGTTWYVLFYPDGENPDTENSTTEDNTQTSKAQKDLDVEISSTNENVRSGKQKAKQACIFLMRDANSSHEMLRHNVRFMISVDGGGEFALEQHFYDTKSNAFGTASFMPVPELKKICQSNELKITVKFIHIVPYFYFGYKVMQESTFGKSFNFKDQNNLPWMFELINKQSSEIVQGTLTLDPNENDRQVKLFSSRKKLLHVCWLVEMLSPVDIDKSITFTSRSRRPLQDTIFGSAGEKDTVTFPLTMRQLCSDESGLLDTDQRLCVRVSILCGNFVVDPTLQELAEITRMRNDVKKVQNMPTIIEEKDENKKYEKLNTSIDSSEQDDKDVMIQSLVDQIDEYEKYIKELEKDSKKAKKKHDETSISALIKRSRPSYEECEDLANMAKAIQIIIKTLPISISKLIHAGGLGQGTIVADHFQLDFIVYLKDYDDQKHRLKILLNAIKERIKEYSSKQPLDKDLDRSNKGTTLPFANRFYRTSKALLFKLGDVNITMLLSRSLDDFGGYKEMYGHAAKVSKDSLHSYIVLSSERRTNFIEMQDNLCKDLICVVKAWSDGIDWHNADNRPSSYLLSLLLIHSFESIQILSISRTPSSEKEVLTEFGINVLQENLHIEWNHYYDPADYPIQRNNPIFYGSIIRDPAIPYHNVCSTGIGDWSQFRRETEKWISSLVY